MTKEEIYRKLKEIVKPHHGYTAQMTAIAEWVNSEFEALKQGQSLPIDSVVGSYSLKVGDKLKMPSGLKAEVIKTKVKVKDEFGGEYYLSDIEVG